MFFRGYRFEHPKTEKSVTLAGWSYLWAGLFGAAYVIYVGYGNVWRALAINIACGLIFVAATAATSFIKPLFQLFVLVGLVPAIVLIQGTAMINIIRTAFRRRGWQIMRG